VERITVVSASATGEILLRQILELVDRRTMAQRIMAQRLLGNANLPTIGRHQRMQAADSMDAHQ
jgi:hypothetical protein